MELGEIGRGIAQRRKQMGLSQEELANQLGVTRQAVSKWESGAALPSVDNMVELARVLNASVDELLLISREERETGLSAESVGRMLDEQAQRQEKRIRRLTAWLIAAASVLVLGVVIFETVGIQRTNRMEKSMNERLASSNMQIQSTINNMSANLAGSVRQALDEGASLLSDGGCRGEEYINETHSVQMKMFAYPRELGGQTEAEFYALLRDGSRITVPAQEVTGGFEGVLDIPLSSGGYTSVVPEGALEIPVGFDGCTSVSLYVSWTKDGMTVTEKLLDRELWADEFCLEIEYVGSHVMAYEGDDMRLLPFAAMKVPDFRPERYPVKAVFEVYFRGEPVHTFGQAVACERGTTFMTVSPEEDLVIPCLDSDGKQIPFEDVVIRAIITDASGDEFTAECSEFGDIA